MDIKKLTLEELKALVYDELAKVEQSQQNIRILNQEINERNKLQSETKTPSGVK